MGNILGKAVKMTAPVFFGYLFLGIAFGIVLEQAGFGPGWAFLMSGTIYAGSLQFVLVPLMAAGASYLTVGLMTLFLGFRHLFYGLSFLEEFPALGRGYPYLVFSLTDETYSVLCSLSPQQRRQKKLVFAVSLLNHCYWVAGSVLGAVAGQLIPLDFTGIDFAMTALFLVILVEQWKGAPSKIPVLVGLGSSLVFLLLLGPDAFLLPSLIVCAGALLIARRKAERALERGER